MATEAWITNFPVACRTLLTPEQICQAALEEKLEEISTGFTWLEEIVDEAYKLFAVKRNKLEQMPKTPCVKQRRQKRTRQVKAANDQDEDAATGAVLPKAVPTKLRFETESPKEEKNSDESQVNDSGRPVRSCRMTSKALYAEEEGQIKKSTRQSRKPVQKSADSSSSETSTSQRGKGKENQPPMVSIAAKGGKENADTPERSIKKWSEQNSPSVRERAKAYETMLKQRSSKSPVKNSRCAATVDSNQKETANKAEPSKGKETNVKRSRSRGSSSKLSRHSLHRKSSKSRHSKRSNSKSSSKLSTEINGTRQTRTRLRLKKQKQDEPETDASEPEPPDSESCNTQSENSDKESHMSTSQDSQPSDNRNSVDMFDEGARDKEEEHQLVTEARDPLNETEMIVTEVYEIQGKGQPAKLKEYEMVKTKTTPVNEIKTQAKITPLGNSSEPPCSSSDQGFVDVDEESGSNSVDMPAGSDKKDGTFTKECHDSDEGTGMATRTRTRAQQKGGAEDNNSSKVSAKMNKDSGVDTGNKESAADGNSTFTKERVSSPQEVVRTTRTRARTQKESATSESSVEERGPSTRTRQKNEASYSSQDSQKSRSQQNDAVKHEPFKATRSRMRTVNDPNKLNICGSDDEVITGSPAVNTPVKAGKKRLAQERGLSPRPKRSCIGDQSSVSTNSPLSTSSPIKKGSDLSAGENNTLFSPIRSSKPYKFSSAQKKTKDFLNRTPGFGQSSSRVYSFLNHTPTCRNSGVLTSFLKRNTPPPKQNIQVLQDQKKQKLLEKESRDKERLKRAAEIRRQKIEEQKRQREEKERKVAESREMRLRMEQAQKEKINKKFEDKAILKEKIMEERTKEEREKQKLRLKKQMEADARRKQEEEERLRKILEQEEETRMQEEFMQRKKEFEEAERKRQIAEEKRKQEERLAELEQKRLEEKARLKQLEEEKERERERVKIEREKQIALERAERERQEREKKEEKERKLKEELDKLKALEKERLKRQEQEALRHQQQEAQQNELKQLINKHNSSINKQSTTTVITTTTTSTVNTLQTASKSNSYDITPVKVKNYNAKMKNPDNYDIEDKGSDDSTDDDEAPKKRIPEWATGIPLNTALIRQHLNPPNLEELFRTSHIEPPDLTILFPGRKRRRYHERTSSANWTSPVMKH